MSHFNTVVIGGGQSGLGVSFYLKQKGISHIVLERGKVGQTWIGQRWDSFVLNTPAWASLLPGDLLNGNKPGEFWNMEVFVGLLEAYVKRFELPVKTDVTVISVRTESSAGGFHVETTAGKFTAENVVVASGIQNDPKIPAVAQKIPGTLYQLHSADFKNAGALPEGAVLVVGSAQSGMQITEDLLDAGRKVYLATSKVGRLFRTFRGRDVMEWAKDIGFFDHTLDDLEDPNMAYAAQPQLTGTHGGHTVSLQSLEKLGAVLLGRLEDWRNGQLYFALNLAENIMFADGVSQKFKEILGGYIEKAGIDAPPLVHEEEDQPDPDPRGRKPPTNLDPVQEGITSLIWCTGFGGKFGWIDNLESDAHGTPFHAKGVSTQPGLYFCGFPWLRSRKSGLVMGIEEDAAVIVKHLSERG